MDGRRGCSVQQLKASGERPRHSSYKEVRTGAREIFVCGISSLWGTSDVECQIQTENNSSNAKWSHP